MLPPLTPGLLLTSSTSKQQTQARRAMSKQKIASLSHYIDLLLDAICLVDAEGFFVDVSAGCERVFGYTRDELIGRNIRELIHPDDLEPTMATADRVLKGQPVTFFENRYIRKDGSVAHIMWSARWAEQDKLRVAVARNISERKHVEAKQHAMYSISEAVHAADNIEQLTANISHAVSSILPGLKLSITHQDGTADLADLTVNCTHNGRLDAADQALFEFINTQVAIAVERHQLLAKLKHLALYDELTGLPNRSLFNDRLDSALKRKQRSGGSLTILYIDLDGFKAINDTWGHEAGDIVLKQVAIRLQDSVRSADTVARLAGDEFVILLEGDGPAHSPWVVAEKIVCNVEQPIRVAEAELRVLPSIGLANFPTDALDATALLRHADHAMYKAKKTRNQYIYPPSPACN